MDEAKRKKLKELYLQLADSDEKEAILKMEKLESIEKSVKEAKPTDISGIEKIVRELEKKISKIKNYDGSDLLEALKEISAKIGMIKLQERVDRDYSPAYKMMIEKLSSVDDRIGGWKFPQYAYTGLRNKSFSPINPSEAGLGLSTYDYVSLTQTSLTDTYKFYQNGSTGTLVATVVITYTDSGKGTISNVSKTPVI